MPDLRCEREDPCIVQTLKSFSSTKKPVLVFAANKLRRMKSRSNAIKNSLGVRYFGPWRRSSGKNGWMQRILVANARFECCFIKAVYRNSASFANYDGKRTTPPTVVGRLGRVDLVKKKPSFSGYSAEAKPWHVQNKLQLWVVFEPRFARFALFIIALNLHYETKILALWHFRGIR